MPDSQTTDGGQLTPAEPPGGGRQDHEAMRAAATRPVVGDASTDTLAAGGGLEVPGFTSVDSAHSDTPSGTAPAESQAREIIPGERDGSTLTTREPGAIGGRVSGADVPSSNSNPLVDKETAHPHAVEGGED